MQASGRRGRGSCGAGCTTEGTGSGAWRRRRACRAASVTPSGAPFLHSVTSLPQLTGAVYQWGVVPGTPMHAQEQGGAAASGVSLDAPHRGHNLLDGVTFSVLALRLCTGGRCRGAPRWTAGSP